MMKSMKSKYQISRYKLIILTGTSGLGQETIMELVKHNPKQIFFTGRNAASAETVLVKTKEYFTDVVFVPCDQTDLKSVASAAKTILEKSNDQIDAVICNAGVMAIPLGVSKDGYEIQFAINHLSHALLIRYFLPALQRAVKERGDARIVSLTSLAFKSPLEGGLLLKHMKSNSARISKYSTPIGIR
jgi:NAD(P)-dependent dehydrogenase (short-subunit alcohol dehydrogenase family)